MSRLTDVFHGQIPKQGDRHRVTFFDFTTKQLATDELYVRRFLKGGSLARQKVDS